MNHLHQGGILRVPTFIYNHVINLWHHIYFDDKLSMLMGRYVKIAIFVFISYEGVKEKQLYILDTANQSVT